MGGKWRWALTGAAMMTASVVIATPEVALTQAEINGCVNNDGSSFEGYPDQRLHGGNGFRTVERQKPVLGVRSGTLWSMSDLAYMVDAAQPKPGKRGAHKKQVA